MSNQKIDTHLVDRAAAFAIKAHSGIARNGKGYPYSLHVMEAAAIVATMTDDAEMIAAAFLHDVIEDTDYTYDDLLKEFGKRIADFVLSESDAPDDGSRSDSWRERKIQTMNRLAHSSREVKIIAMGDKLSNMRAIWRDYKVQGDNLWQIFNVKERSAHEWHYRTLAACLSDLSDTYAYKEFERLVEDVFGKKPRGIGL